MAMRAVRAALLCASLLFIQQASAELRGRCPAEDGACPPRATPCHEDDDCGEQICCNTSCGRTCVEPLYTGCENIKLSSERISRALAAENTRSGRGAIRSLRSPRCKVTDGEFEEIQCDNEIVSTCWCVDAAGFEVPGTRAPAAGLVNCTNSAPCAAHTCRMLCPLGFELDNRGCPLCKCRDPCSSVTCPGQLSCQLEETPCLRPPCPPVPTCKRGRSLQNICPVGEPLLISETSRPVLCGTDPGKPNCPPLYRCLVESGNDYGVCCPASLELQKAGTCPKPSTSDLDCGTPCAHDLECPSMQKCCDGGECGKHCTLPYNVTMCTQQKMLAELLVVSEREGRGYVPQCSANGSFVSKQCSRNGLVCWCVDTDGNKLRGSMGPSDSVRCSPTPRPARSGGRSLSSCTRALCAGVCEYGYKTGSDGCPTCECDDPCAGFPCDDGEECVRVRDADCSGELCTGYPVCRPKVSYDNPCEVGAPATDEEGSVMACGTIQDCPSAHVCTTARRNGAAVCCPDPNFVDNSTDSEVLEINFESCGPEAEAVCSVNSTISCSEGICDEGLVCCSTDKCGPVCVDAAKMRLQTERIDDIPTMCEYLRDFDEKMEGTVDGMKLALPAPTCQPDGSFTPQQCANGRCWCVDSSGTEIPDTRTNDSSTIDCEKVRSELSCLDLTCRMGCDYGFELGAGRCPTCKCRDPCVGVTCPSGRACALVDVACDADYCPPVPACLPRKAGQCPYLVPWTGACEWACRSDAECGAEQRCCATGCGTACTSVVHQTACQQRRALAVHTAAESGNPPAWTWVPECKEDGTYAQVQCRGSSKKMCWCVDTAGNEVPGTRSTNSTPNCDAPAICPDPGCDVEEICPHGRLLDNKGCPTCVCRDPCAEAKCREDETCELVPLDCEGESCPPLARCSPSPQCPEGEPLQAPDGSGALLCGPNAAACPYTHACRFAPHDSRPSVCCPKPRSVCFESKDEGDCDSGEGLNTTRWHFNHERNRCERFKYHGCSGNHNNFRTKEECNSVCPVKKEKGKLSKQKSRRKMNGSEVLSPCERLREKNEAAALKYGKGTFIPKCDASGAWESVQCMSHIDVCWCVSARGEPQKGSLVRGAKPTCNFRQARKWVRRDPLDEKARADEVLEELIRQMTTFREDEFEEEDEDFDNIEQGPEHRGGDDPLSTELSSSEDTSVLSEVIEPKLAETTRKNITPVEVVAEKNSFKTKCQLMQEEIDNGAEGWRPRCLPDGSFSPRQCGRARCWCVDAAGQTRPGTKTYSTDPCEVTQIESALLELELIGAEEAIGNKAQALLASRLSALGAQVPVTMSKDRELVKLRVLLPGPRAADLVYHLETQVKKEKLSGANKSEEGVIGADVIRSEYRLVAPSPAMQREILSESTVSAATSYHTALIVLAATSAFIISVLCVLVMLYRARLQREPHKAERFLPVAPPVYVLSADEKAELARVLHAPPPPVPPNDDHTRV
ncbi:kielin/chordin-like protein isoform X1 [Maniola jurtina]|uniref:kielin/chordin-like protein isoform X1 n=1 Tax=Maniola jurtina TaxID=191418 RepID=UPI001E68A43E|nr:kielin/chordin-like protein isoform X1 [Maniola jurtina]XP_045777098.1 kielin/chordin-like protein isoform X1 [Maniola jurtina]